MKQGVTLEVVGESYSMGPANDRFKSWLKETQGDIQYDIEWVSKPLVPTVHVVDTCLNPSRRFI